MTSAAGENAADHPATLPVEKLLADCTVERTRRSGPGGQHRNKVETAVVLVHGPTGVRGEASERRSQSENHRVAVFRLRVRLALMMRTPVGPTPSKLWQERTARGRMLISPEHDDFPALVAEALNTLAAEQWDAAGAAQRLGVSSSQLVKVLKLEPEALVQVNRQRNALGLGAYR